MIEKTKWNVLPNNFIKMSRDCPVIQSRRTFWGLLPLLPVVFVPHLLWLFLSFVFWRIFSKFLSSEQDRVAEDSWRLVPISSEGPPRQYLHAYSSSFPKWLDWNPHYCKHNSVIWHTFLWANYLKLLQGLLQIDIHSFPIELRLHAIHDDHLLAMQCMEWNFRRTFH